MFPAFRASALLAFVSGLALFTRVEAAPKVSLNLVAEGLTSPMSLAALPEGGLLIVDQVGYIRRWKAAGGLEEAPVLTLTNRLSAINHGAFDERGVLCLALHPQFARNRRVFVTYTAPRRSSAPADWDCTLRLSEFRLPAGEPLRIDPASERVVLEIDKPYSNHNGGRLAFGPDGFLYVSVGDGGNGNDQGRRPETGNGQDTSVLLGKVLRLNLDGGVPYEVPADNPFVVGGKGRPEIFAYGLRNVWGLSFDRGGTHELFAADVGQNLYEEVNILVKGGNYGWSLREGFHGFSAKSPNTPPEPGAKTGPSGEPLADPIFEYRHTGPKKDPEALGISITGGYVYRGRALPDLVGHYVFADWSRNWALPQGQLIVARRPATGTGRWALEVMEVAKPEKWGAYVTGFGEDLDGELYVLTNGSNGLTPGRGRVWKLGAAE
jgi:glucose/arabinose dehydrogenase